MEKIKLPFFIPTTDNEPLFACSWNDGEILEIHTEKSFIEEYSDSLKDSCDYVFYKFLSENTTLYGSFEEAFDRLKDHTIGCKIISDNMQIVKIN